MKKLVLLVFFFASCNFFSQTESIKSVKIGNQTWMIKNLNVCIFRNGDTIPEAKTNEEWQKAAEERKPVWCFYNNDSKNGAKYGKLYNWYAVNDNRGLAPEGWHLPTESDWMVLSNYLGVSAGKKMKSISGWKDNQGKTGNGGFRESKGNFSPTGISAIFWSKSELNIANAFAFGFSYYYDELGKNDYSKGEGFSVRCIKD